MSEPKEIVETRGDDRVDLLATDTNGDGTGCGTDGEGGGGDGDAPSSRRGSVNGGRSAVAG